MEVTDAGMMTDARLEQLSNAASSMVVTDAGMVMEVIAVFPNVFPPMVGNWIPAANVTDARLVQK